MNQSITLLSKTEVSKLSCFFKLGLLRAFTDDSKILYNFVLVGAGEKYFPTEFMIRKVSQMLGWLKNPYFDSHVQSTML